MAGVMAGTGAAMAILLRGSLFKLRGRRFFEHCFANRELLGADLADLFFWTKVSGWLQRTQRRSDKVLSCFWATEYVPRVWSGADSMEYVP
jgi:hypothetical protein